MPEPLPPNPFDSLSDEHAAYESCLNFEAFGSSNWVGNLSSEAAMFKFSPEVAARVLGFALIHSPSNACLAREISSCDNNREFLAGLSYLYVMSIIRIFKHPKDAISTPMSAQPPFQATADNIATLLSQPTVTSNNAKKLALVRDNYRCIMSGNVDDDSLRNGLTTIDLPAGERKTSTELGHIFSESTTYHIVGLTDAAQKKLDWASSSSAVIERFAGISVVEELNQNNVHRPENTFTISPEFHRLFDRLQLSLHPIEQDGSNTYEIHTYPPYENAEYGLPYQVTLTDTTGGQIPLPSRRYFQLRDACAKIAHFSGAGEVMEQLFRELQDAKVLAEDGGSHHLLSLALLSCSQAQRVH
ncbi:hypothetical protein DFS33DRAFT_1269795 [Desarmillaria ectypa]|nr:hypothetical protein DFS33DRAFT_1269795 [Desarmillaria ectypa]